MVTYSLKMRDVRSNGKWISFFYEDPELFHSRNRAKQKLRSLLSEAYYQEYVKIGFEFCVERKVVHEVVKVFADGYQKVTSEKVFYELFNEPIPVAKPVVILPDGLSKI